MIITVLFKRAYNFTSQQSIESIMVIIQVCVRNY